MTGSPTFQPLTPSPSESMAPQASVPGTCPTRPEAAFQSTGLTPAARTLMSTSPRPGFGTGISTTDSEPSELTRTPRMVAGAALATPAHASRINHLHERIPHSYRRV